MLTYALTLSSRRNYQRRIRQLEAIRTIQRNGRALIKARDWKWWRLFMKIKPILQATHCEDDVRRLQTELDSRTVHLKEVQQEFDQLHRERETIHQDVQALVQQLEALRAVRNVVGVLWSHTSFVGLQSSTCTDP